MALYVCGTWHFILNCISFSTVFFVALGLHVKRNKPNKVLISKNIFFTNYTIIKNVYLILRDLKSLKILGM